MTDHNETDNVPPDEDEEIRDLVEHGVISLCMTEDGDVGIWLWGANLAYDPPFAVGDTPQEALLIAARNYAAGGRPASVGETNRE